jgi:hypothetical protein
MIIGNSAIHQLVSKAVAHTNLDTTDRDAYSSSLAGAPAPVSAIAGNNDSSAQSSTSDSGYNESFAKMMVNLKAALANTTSSVSDDQQAAAGAVSAAASTTADKQMAASDSVTKTVDSAITAADSAADTSSTSSASQQLLSYLNQNDAGKVREQLTGVSQQQYNSMTPEQQAAVDKKVSDVKKQETQVAEQEINARIAMAKAEMA